MSSNSPTFVVTETRREYDERREKRSEETGRKRSNEN